MENGADNYKVLKNGHLYFQPSRVAPCSLIMTLEDVGGGAWWSVGPVGRPPLSDSLPGSQGGVRSLTKRLESQPDGCRWGKGGPAVSSTPEQSSTFIT